VLMLFFSLCLFDLKAQRGYKIEYGGVLGVSNYLGEIGGKELDARHDARDLKMAQTRWNPGIYFKYQFAQSFAVKTAFNYLRIAGKDELTANEGRRYRNLSFRNDIYELNATLNWLFYNPTRPSGLYGRSSVYFAAYLFGGIGGFMHNPKANYRDEWIDLRPLQTENEKYGKFSFCVPVGTGFFVTINQRRRAHRIGLEMSWRFTGTDYLDDISKDSWENPLTQSELSAALANRNPELGNNQPDGMSGNYGWHDDGAGGNKNKAPRGSPDYNDSFLTITVTYGYTFKSKYHKSRNKKIRSVTF